MANKEFQARHGLIVNTNLLIANVITGNVSVNGNVSISNTLVVGNTNLFQRANSLVFSANGSDAFVITPNTTGVMLEVINTATQLRVFSVSDTGNVYAASNVSANYFYGNGATLVGISSNPDYINININIGTSSNASNVYAMTFANGTANSANAYATTVGAASNTWANTKLANTSGVSFAGSLFFPTGNVGIGITAPTSNLHVVGNANVSTNLRVGGNVSFDNIDSVRLWEPAANTLTIHTASTERVRVDSNGNVAIGTTTSGEPLTVSRNTTNNSSSVLVGTVARFIGQDGVQGRVILDAYGAATNMTFRHASGTAASPTATTSGSVIMGLNGFGYGTTGYTTLTKASFYAFATENWTDTAQGTYLSFGTTAGGSVTHAEKMRIDANGNVGIGVTPTARNNSRLQIVDGIGFPEVQVASSDANTLDDYEEGTWTPSITFGGAAVGITYTTQSGTYTKIGNIVVCRGRVTLSNKGSSTGSALITSLPFTAASGTDAYAFAGFGYYTNMTSITGNMIGYVNISATTFNIIMGGTTAITAVANTNFNNNSDIIFTVTYQVA